MQQQQKQQRHSGKRESAPYLDNLLHSNLLYKEQNTTTNDEIEAMAIAYDKFNSSMSLVLKYTQHYKDEYLVHTSRLKNPWHTIVENQRHKIWQVSDLKVGDLFYFSLPFDDIGTDLSDALVYNARKRIVYVKRELLTAQQSNKGRRWFLYDMLGNIMPNVMIHLEDPKTFLQNYGGDGIRFPIFLFREKELHFGERALHPGNVVEVIDQIRFYISQNVEKSIGIDGARLLQLTQQLDDIEKGVNVNSLFDAYSPSVPLFAVCEDEDDAGGYGHGTSSSDSEIRD
ncbi:hypothetical protein LSM04_005172 [Trypanosoma melophagium]|uniref:uncharacterized protein n=1 Tax=Trypanosoma melophagium TaxID=715481 RepID=UPI00351A20AE|nr:hypothetical protein LSM04_005172 [Trypanosoma melophagium]